MEIIPAFQIARKSPWLVSHIHNLRILLGSWQLLESQVSTIVKCAYHVYLGRRLCFLLLGAV